MVEKQHVCNKIFNQSYYLPPFLPNSFKTITLINSLNLHPIYRALLINYYLSSIENPKEKVFNIIIKCCKKLYITQISLKNCFRKKMIIIKIWIKTRENNLCLFNIPQYNISLKEFFFSDIAWLIWLLLLISTWSWLYKNFGAPGHTGTLRKKMGQNQHYTYCKNRERLQIKWKFAWIIQYVPL